MIAVVGLAALLLRWRDRIAKLESSLHWTVAVSTNLIGEPEYSSIPAGWVLVLLLARKSWRRYLELQQLADNSKYEYASTEHLPPVR